MKIRDEKIEIFCNGKCIDTTHLNRGYQSAVFYFENEDAAAAIAQGKTKKQAKINYLSRAAVALFNAAMKYTKDVFQLDVETAECLYEQFTDALQPQDTEDSIYLGAGVFCNREAFDRSLEALREESATLFKMKDGQAVNLDGGEPIKLKGFNPDEIKIQ